MLYDIWARATGKWRAILVYSLLQAFTRFVTSVIYTRAEGSGWQLYASVVSLGVSLFCLTQLWRLLSRDQEGDESWPVLWS